MDFQDLYDDFKDRAQQVLELLHAPTTGFVVVTTLEGPPLGEASFFIDRLVDENMPLAGVVANKVVPLRFADRDEALRALEDPDARAAAEVAGVDREEARTTLAEARRALVTLGDIAERDRRKLDELRRRARTAIAPVPLFTKDVHDLASLRELADHALGG
jgi:anion-transporting  ArsA/GET3 family ATPase